MKLLQVTVTNHRSFGESFTLDLTRPAFNEFENSKSNRWGDAIFPVAAIYGANASGKTSVIRAIDYIRRAIKDSSGSWLSHSEMVREPFKLSEDSRQGLSSYVMDFVFEGGHPNQTGNGVWYHYEFSVSPVGVEHELLSFNASNNQKEMVPLFEKKKIDGEFKFYWLPKKEFLSISNLPPETKYTFDISPRELMLSRGRMLGVPLFSTLANEIIDTLDIFYASDSREFTRRVVLPLEKKEDPQMLQDLSTLANIADFGIKNITVRKDKNQLYTILAKELSTFLTMQDNGSFDDDTETAKAAASKLVFQHSSNNDSAKTSNAAGDVSTLSYIEESSGTLSWLALAYSAITALRNGGVLCVDELGEGLHPYLSALIVESFQNLEINRRGAQLIFTTQDTSFLSPYLHLDLKKDQIWFTEKNQCGISELFSLGDFVDAKDSANMAKHFLEGRYGGVPATVSAQLNELLDKE